MWDAIIFNISGVVLSGRYCQWKDYINLHRHWLLIPGDDSENEGKDDSRLVFGWIVSRDTFQSFEWALLSPA